MHCPALTALFLATTLLALRADPAPPSHATAFTPDGLLKADVSSLPDTFLIAHPATALDPATNVIWCATLQLAWNDAIALVGEKLRFTTASPVVEMLNREDFTAADLDPASYVALADFERNHVEAEIRAALEKTFHGSAAPELIPPVPPHPGPDDFVAYAYLFKNLAFAHPFSDSGYLNFGGRPVANFGFDEETRLDNGAPSQVQIDDYQARDNFIIELKTKSAADQLIIAQVTPAATLEATIDAVLARIAKTPPAPVEPGDTLRVPKLNFDLRHSFTDLQGLVLQPTPAAKITTPLILSEVQQLVRFQLNEKGAVLKSEATITATALAMRTDHLLIVDHPFLLLLKETSSPRPYLALWIGNPTLLVPAK